MLLSIFPFPLTMIPGCSFLEDAMTGIYSPIITWIGLDILSLGKDIRSTPTGSGDMTFYYLLNAFLLSVAFLGTIIWTLLSRTKEVHSHLNDFLLILLRYYLAFNMLSYGFYKVFPLQFPEPSFARLLQPYGESSPMGLAWTFLGYSSAYSVFAGMGEVIGGLLLLHRRTAILGSLIVIVVMTNVFVMNMCFDIPVKLFSFKLLLISILIAYPSIKRILNVILFNKAVPPLTFNAYFSSPSWDLSKRIVKWGTVLHLISFHYSSAVDAAALYGPGAPKPSLYGLYKTTSFVEDGDTLAPLVTNKQRWQYFIIERKGMAQIMGMDGSLKYFRMEVNDSLESIKLTTRDSTEIANLHYMATDSTMLMEGVFKGDSISCKSRILQKSDFLLMSRGFRWINEYPYNR